jgi:hypothetical protein
MAKLVGDLDGVEVLRRWQPMVNRWHNECGSIAGWKRARWEAKWESGLLLSDLVQG